MTPFEKRAASALAAIFSFRMLGLFMILPVFALYADGFEGVTHTKIGIAIGAYGLTQALLQIPYGMMSDRWGRKPVIVVGLLIFGLGSVIAAYATTIEGVIFGRALQGAGAIASVIMALLADLTREEHRTKAMATIGISIGFSFLIAMVLGPIMGSWVGIKGIFLLTAILAVVGIIILLFVVPNPRDSHFHQDAETRPTLLREVIKDGQLLRLDLGIFTLHLVLTANFVVIPFMLRDTGLDVSSQWIFYLPVMVLAMGCMVPFIIIAEKYHKMKTVFSGAIAALVIAELLMTLAEGNVWMIAVIVWLFFTAFNLLEASLPSLVSKFSPATRKGTAMGIYSSSQFIGTFLGGIIGGSVYSVGGDSGVFLVCAALLVIWLIFAATMQHPRYFTTMLLKLGTLGTEHVANTEQAIAAIKGVKEVAINREEMVAYLKVEQKELDIESLEQYAVKED
jgi:predicted MFS family arabinose efflux permease